MFHHDNKVKKMGNLKTLITSCNYRVPDVHMGWFRDVNSICIWAIFRCSYVEMKDVNTIAVIYAYVISLAVDVGQST